MEKEIIIENVEKLMIMHKNGLPGSVSLDKTLFKPILLIEK